VKAIGIRVAAIGVVAAAVGIYAQISVSGDDRLPNREPVNIAVDKAVKWLVSVQGKDGGWGQDGGETSYVRQGEHLESSGNDVANTAVAVTALLHAGNTSLKGQQREAIQRGLKFILERVERSPEGGLAITDVSGTQIQRKLGPYIDTFLTSKLLAELDGTMGSPAENARVRKDLQKCVAKIEKNQLKDGSWNISGGWAPILGTSMASRSLFVAQQKGVAVSAAAMGLVTEYTVASAAPPPSRAGFAGGGGVGAGIGVGTPAASVVSASAMTAAAGVSLYSGAQQLEQLTRTDKERARNKDQIKTIVDQLDNPQFINGFGSFGGEEFFSYLNISDSLHRAGGAEWEKWNHDIKTKMLKLQNEDGTWAGHHCITGRVAVTSGAVLTLLAEHDKGVAQTVSSRN
jgi:hypothetical protein